MRGSLDAACGQFEQVILAQMLRTAGIGKTNEFHSEDADGDADTHAGDDAFQQLFVQALSDALERAGGIGLEQALRARVADARP